MTPNVYLVRLRRPSQSIQRVQADRYEIQGDHLVFLLADGRLAALFMLEAVESFNEMTTE